jgi:hypothetical protein
MIAVQALENRTTELKQTKAELAALAGGWRHWSWDRINLPRQSGKFHELWRHNYWSNHSSRDDFQEQASQ